MEIDWTSSQSVSAATYYVGITVQTGNVFKIARKSGGTPNSNLEHFPRLHFAGPDSGAVVHNFPNTLRRCLGRITVMAEYTIPSDRIGVTSERPKRRDRRHSDLFRWAEYNGLRWD